MSSVRVEPRVTWPRTVVPGEPFLVSVDLALVEPADRMWPFDDEEIEFTCVLDGSRHFRVEAVHDASVVMHRFGGTYGPAQFVVVAQQRPGLHTLRLTPVTSRGIVMGSLELQVTVAVADEEQGVEGELHPVDLAPAAGVTGAGADSSRRSALCIVVGRYSKENGLADLPGAYDAGNRVVDGLQSLGYTITYMIDPGGAELSDKLRRFLADDESSLRVVYFSGHGLVHHGDFFLAGTDAGVTSPREGRLVPFRHLQQMDRSRETGGNPALFLLDACYSGTAALPEDWLSLPGEVRYEGFPRSYVVASSGSSERSFNHLFSESLADVLDGAAAGRPAGYGESVPFNVFAAEVRRRMRERAPRLPQTLAASLEPSHSTEPAFIPVLAPADSHELNDVKSLRVLGVHGSSNQVWGAQQIALHWLPIVQDSVLRVDPSANVADIELSIAYYADLLARPYAQGGSAPDGEESEALEGWPAVENESTQRRFNPAGLVRQAMSYLTSGSASITSRQLERALFGSLRELGRYLQGEQRGDVIARVHRVFTEARPGVILAHSLGSVVAYDALWQEPYPQVEVLVTMGSPLAMSSVRDRLMSPELGRPPGVKKWVDIASTGDVVAVPINGMTRHFGGVEGKRIDTTVLPSHTVASYLQSTEVAFILAGLLRRLQG
ncbi:caspase family protein [Streptomyces sp. NPDC049970]|uniref:caspase family protein n=1 Tax=Streptomyces sp. NPDC049970 TaxID=3155033 RepID=UPI0034447B10